MCRVHERIWKCKICGHQCHLPSSIIAFITIPCLQTVAKHSVVKMQGFGVTNTISLLEILFETSLSVQLYFSLRLLVLSPCVSFFLSAIAGSSLSLIYALSLCLLFSSQKLYVHLNIPDIFFSPAFSHIVQRMVSMQ